MAAIFLESAESAPVAKSTEIDSRLSLFCSRNMQITKLRVGRAKDFAEKVRYFENILLLVFSLQKLAL